MRMLLALLLLAVVAYVHVSVYVPLNPSTCPEMRKNNQISKFCSSADEPLCNVRIGIRMRESDGISEMDMWYRAVK